MPSTTSSTTSTTMGSTRLHTKRSPVPLLLSSFPTPPTHIPVSPVPSTPATPATPPTIPSAGNPPPSRPPSLPLPPLPGPSPISEQETLMFMSTRSHRLSKMSTTSSVYSSSSPASQRNSTASSTSVDHSSTSPSTASFNKRESVLSNHSVRSVSSSTGSLSVPVANHSRYPRSPVLSPPLITEEGEDIQRTSFKTLASHSNIDILETLVAVQDNAEKVISPVSASTLVSPPYQADPVPSPSASYAPTDDVEDWELDPDTEAQILHLEMRAFRSKSEKHKHQLVNAANTIRARSRSRSRSRPSSPNRKQILEVPPVPRVRKDGRPLAMRPESPDIKTILDSTPRPRRRASASFSASSRSRSRRRVSEGVSRNRASDTGSVVTRRKSDGSAMRRRSRSPFELAYMQDDAVDGSVVHEMAEDMAADEADMLERELEGGSDSDSSSIDLHTPLPHLMLRDGLLSPNSKLLPGMARSPSPQTVDASIRPGSVVSQTPSVMTKSGIYKDERDTERRRTRHRDGRLLKGGLGLTTGLGWSDSEDEDAPSPLTRRLSSMTVGLSRKSSATSIVSSAHPLSRSYSGHPCGVEQNTPKLRSSLPPTSWQKRAASGTNSNRSTLSSPSSASTFASMPPTPQDGTHGLLDKPLPTLPVVRKIQSNSSLRSPRVTRSPSVSRVSSTGLSAGVPTQRSSGPPATQRARKYSSSGSSTSSLGAAVSNSRLGRGDSSMSSPAVPAMPASSTEPRSPTTPRPLRLAQSRSGALSNIGVNGNGGRQLKTKPSTGSLRQPGQGVASTPKPVSKLARPSLESLSSVSRQNSGVKPKPRTGAGMVYRTASSAAPRTLKMPSANVGMSAGGNSDGHVSNPNVGIGVAL